MRPTAVFAFPLVLTALAGPACAEAMRDPALYRCRAIITGSDQRTRPDGLAQCLPRVLVAVSGNPALADDPRVEAMAPDTAGMVEDFVYVDRMSDQPLHDEQGSRDRPFDMTIAFDPAKIDGALATLGAKPWPAPRPALAVSVEIRDRRGGRFRLDADTLAAERQREALLAAGERLGMRIVLLPEVDLPPIDAPPAEMAARAARTVVSVPVVGLTGTLAWSEADFGWVGEWRLALPAGDAAWSIRGVSFDEAFRDAVGGAAARLSGAR